VKVEEVTNRVSSQVTTFYHCLAESSRPAHSHLSLFKGAFVCLPLIAYSVQRPLRLGRSLSSPSARQKRQQADFQQAFQAPSGTLSAAAAPPPGAWAHMYWPYRSTTHYYYLRSSLGTVPQVPTPPQPTVLVRSFPQ